MKTVGRLTYFRLGTYLLQRIMAGVPRVACGCKFCNDLSVLGQRHAHILVLHLQIIWNLYLDVSCLAIVVRTFKPARSAIYLQTRV